jgi:enolase
MMKSSIKEVCAREILDSRGNPTVEATVTLEDGSLGTAAVPSGASVGKYEAHERRDGDKDYYGGKGVRGAVEAIRVEISREIIGKDARDQRRIDEAMIELDGDRQKARLGANAILAVSVATARAAAAHHGLPLYKYLGGTRAVHMPIPMMNILNGGAHAKNNVEIQEFMIVPSGSPTSADAVRECVEVYRALGKILERRGLATGIGDEGGYAPDLSSDEEACELICEAIEAAGLGGKMKLALDVASSGWHTGDGYFMPKTRKKRDTGALIDYYRGLIRDYPIISIEDGLGEDDCDGWRELTDALGRDILLVGDDLFVTNIARLEMGVNLRIANSILIKPNQIGTLTETLGVMDLATRHGYVNIVSHRSGETSDDLIADLAVATGARYIKAGAPARGERVAKYNRLMAIEGEISRG